MDSKFDDPKYSNFFEETQSDIDDIPNYTCYLCNSTYEKDLQLAAELGKTLLERNKELEASLKHHQSIIEDQTQEIEYLTKQTAALKEVNESRLRIYEQLEISIQDLERANQRLNQQTIADKKQIKNLYATIESLECCRDDLQKTLDNTTVDLESERRKLQILQQPTSPALVSSTVKDGGKFAFDLETNLNKSINEEDDEEIRNLLVQIQQTRSLRAKEQRKAEELEEQLNSALQENQILHEQLNELRQKEEDFRGVHEELTMLEQIRQGQLCRRCLRNADSPAIDQLSLPAADDENDADSISDINSVIESQRNEVLKQIQETSLDDAKTENPYRILVEKYEALLKIQQQKFENARKHVTSLPTKCLSLQDELMLTGNYKPFQNSDVDSDEYDSEVPIASDNFSNTYIKSHKNTTITITPITINNNNNNNSNNNSNSNNIPIKSKKLPNNGTSCTDLIEAETSSSGFSDDISNKGTQTDVHVLPGSFLCTITDGTDCQFNIYDDASPIESRFRKTPEYRQLFKEIFAVLRRAAELKDDGEPLPLLDDNVPTGKISEILSSPPPKVPPVTPAKEENPVLFSRTGYDDVLNDLQRSIEDDKNQLLSDDIRNTSQIDTVIDRNLAIQSLNGADNNLLQSNHSSDSTYKPSLCDSPKRDRMEDLAAGVKLRRKDRRNANKLADVKQESSSTPQFKATPKRNNSKARKRREQLVTHSPNRSRERHQQRSSWCVPPFVKQTDSGNNNDSLNMYPPIKDQTSTTVRDRPTSLYDPAYSSAASESVTKLKILEKSYAEVLRMGSRKKLSGTKKG